MKSIQQLPLARQSKILADAYVRARRDPATGKAMFNFLIHTGVRISPEDLREANRQIAEEKAEEDEECHCCKLLWTPKSDLRAAA